MKTGTRFYLKVLFGISIIALWIAFPIIVAVIGVALTVGLVWSNHTVIRRWRDR